MIQYDENSKNMPEIGKNKFELICAEKCRESIKNHKLKAEENDWIEIKEAFFKNSLIILLACWKYVDLYEFV